MEREKNKRGNFWQDYLGYILLAVAFLVIMFGGYLVLSGKSTTAVAYAKHLVRFGRA